MSSSNPLVFHSAEPVGRLTGALLVRDSSGTYRAASGDEVLTQARRILSCRVRSGATLASPRAVKDFLSLKIGHLEHEVFCVLFLDAQIRVIEFRDDVPRDGDADIGLSAEDRQGGAGGECGLSRSCAQPPLRDGRAESRGRASDGCPASTILSCALTHQFCHR